MQTLWLFLIALGIGVSVRERKRLMMWRSHQVSSPLASVLSQLVGTAGSIYLSLELLFSFLKIPEEWWAPSTCFVEPLAAISLILAILQPFGWKAWKLLRR